MKLLEQMRDRLRESPRTRSIFLYFGFVVISAVFWSFLTFNSDVQLDVEVPVELSLPNNVHLLAKVPDTLTVTVKDRGYRFISYLFHKTPKLTLRFSDYSDGNSTFKIDQSHLKKALAPVLNKNADIVSVLPESINIRFTDQPGKKVPVKTCPLSIPCNVEFQFAITFYLSTFNFQLSTFYATRSLALRDRGLRATSAASAISPFSMRRKGVRIMP